MPFFFEISLIIFGDLFQKEKMVDDFLKKKVSPLKSYIYYFNSGCQKKAQSSD